MGYPQLLEATGQVNDLLNAASLLAWDSRTMMPARGAATRARQIATLTLAARAALLSPEMRRAAEAAARQPAAEGSAEAAMLAQVQDAIAYHDRIPAALLQRRTELAVTAHEVWAEAVRQNDFRHFQPALEEMVAVSRAWAEAAGYAAHPYDALLELYEPGNTVANLRPLYSRLAEVIGPLAREAAAAPQPRDDFLRRDYPPERQLAVALRLAEAIGYDLSRGRLDLALHPFEISFTREDVRLTTRVRRDNLAEAIFTTLHEAGHGIYEQQVDPAWTRTPLATDLILLYAVGGVSFGAHESQSRLWEMHVGRSRAFWDRHFPALRDAFPDQLADVRAEDFWRAANRCRTGPVRSGADELTYDLHTLFRTDIETRLIEGSLPVREVRDAWNDATRTHLGVTPPDDAHGVLQDVHWCTGQFGTFCNYTIGNVMAAQLFETAAALPQVASGLARAEYDGLRDWLTQHVLRHGRRHSREVLLERATGRGLDPEPYLRHLRARAAEVFGLERADA